MAPEQLAFKICRLQREEPELYGKIKAFLSLKDFVNCKLTGISAIDHTTASYSLLYDVEKRRLPAVTLCFLLLNHRKRNTE